MCVIVCLCSYTIQKPTNKTNHTPQNIHETTLTQQRHETHTHNNKNKKWFVQVCLFYVYGALSVFVDVLFVCLSCPYVAVIFFWGGIVLGVFCLWLLLVSQKKITTQNNSHKQTSNNTQDTNTKQTKPKRNNTKQCKTSTQKTSIERERPREQRRRRKGASYMPTSLGYMLQKS